MNTPQNPNVHYVGLKKRGLWWRPNGCGYTDKEVEAGRYTLDEANGLAHGGTEPVTIHEFSAPAPRVLADLLLAGNLFPLARPYWKPPFHYDADSQAIYDSDTNAAAYLSGWRMLTGPMSSHHLPEGKAGAVQDELGQHLCLMLNAAWRGQPQYNPEPVWEPVPKGENRYAGYRKGDLRIWHWVFPVGPDGFCVSRVDATSGKSSPLGVFETLDAAKQYARDWCEDPKTNPQVNT